MMFQPLVAVLERGETALAQVVLDARERAQAAVDCDGDSLPCLVWNDIRESARVRARLLINQPTTLKPRANNSVLPKDGIT